MRKLLFILILLLSFSSLFAQVHLEGYVTEQSIGEKKELAFARVILKNVQDSLVVEHYTMTDMKGHYEFKNIPMKEYWIEISYLGYQSINELIEVDFPSIGNSIFLDYELKLDDVALNEVVVTGQSVRRGIDRTSYQIISRDLKHARSSMDLLEKIPTMYIDMQSQKIASSKGNIKILIDGISASEIDLKAIPPDKVARIDYYDIPPARYMEYATVVNVITRTLDDGFSVGTSLHHAFTTGFANDDVFFKFNKGNQQFSIDYAINYRNYDDVKTVNKYEYPINDKAITRLENNISPFGYNNHYINLKYINQKTDNYVFQTKFSPNMSFNHSKNESEIESQIDLDIATRKGFKHDKSDVFNPSLNLYFWKQLTNKQTFTIDVLGNMFFADQAITNNERNTVNDLLELYDQMYLENRKKTLITELSYDKEFDKGKLSIGNKFQNYTMNSNVQNSFNENEYKSSSLSNYLYGEYVGTLNKFVYRASLGVMYRSNQNNVIKRSSFVFQPVFLFGYNVNSKNSFRFVLSQSSQEPEISEQSDNVIFITDNILRKGNPDLKNRLSQVFLLNYAFTDRKIDMNLSLIGGKIENGINSYFLQESESYSLTPINEDNEVLGISHSFLVKPFNNNIFNIRINGGVYRTVTKNDIVGKFTYWSTPIQYNLSMNFGAFIASYQGNIVDKSISGTYSIQDENMSHFSLRYTRENFSIWGSLLFAFTPSKYITETISQSMVSYSSIRNIYDNKNMFTLGLSYTFNSGKKYEEKRKTINNYDSDSGLFK